MAISETIKILNDDDALDSFKKALPQKTSFLQAKSDPTRDAVFGRGDSKVEPSQGLYHTIYTI